MPRLRVVQIGICHEHAAAKMRTLRALPEVFEVVGVVDDRTLHAASAHIVEECLTAYDGLTWLSEAEALAMPGLDAVLVETPNADLVATALRCLEHDLPMHMDKPAGWDLAAFDRLLSGCDARGLPFQMGFMFRANPAFAFCAQAVQAGWIGEISSIQADMSHDYGGEAYQRYLARMPGGIMFNLGCHLIDAVAGLLGRPQRVVPLNLSTSDVADGTANLCQATLIYPHAFATVNACSRKAGGLDARRMVVCGSNGTIELSPLERFDGQPLAVHLTLREARGGHPAGRSVIDCGARRDRYREHLLEFADMVRTRTRGRHGSAHDRLVHEITLAASGCIDWTA
ncbi:MAG: Gfo/Idh/MocA family oxidoreductase [Planctomycetes bacterium]|nr:Gfo/Idh/MocA family oxidoreductase [Planctomycetota bacterium]